MQILVRWVLPLLFTALAKDIMLGVVLLLLRKIADKTKNTLDNEVLDLIETKIKEAESKLH